MQVTQPGPDTFLDLYDTPNSYAGSATKVVNVNSGATGLEFSSPSGGGSPGGSVGSVQTNDGAGGFAGDTGFLYSGGLVGIGSGVATYLTETLTILGTFSIVDPFSVFKALLNTGLLNRDQVYAFPDKSGTFAMTSDITAGIGGSTGAIDNALLRADGAGGLTLQATGVIIDDFDSYTASAPLGSEKVPALTAGNWTVGTGWESPIVGPGLIKNANGTGTQTPSGTFTIVAGRTYKVTAQLSSFTSGSVNFFVGGAPVMTLGSTTLTTEYVVARTTAKLILIPTNSSRFTVGSISVKEVTDGYANLTIDGDLTARGDFSLVGRITIQGGLAIGHSGSIGNNANWFLAGAGGSLNHNVGGFIIGIGPGAVANASSGSANQGFGFSALTSATGNDNLAFGSFACWFNSTGGNNAGYGSSALALGTVASRNTAFGREALSSNDSTAEGVAIGYQAGFSFGAAALALGTGGNGLVLIGGSSGRDLTSGVNNTMLGFNTGRGVTTGTGNTVVGAQVTGLATTLSNNIIVAIGTGAIKAQYDLTSNNWALTGTVSPTGTIILRAGTATAGTAPLVFASGPLLTVAVAGTIEFLTDSYYGTTTTGAVRRMLVAGNTGRATGQTAANNSVATYTLGATDATYEVSANVLVTTSSAENFTVTVTYTDEGNTARTLTLNFQTIAGVIGTAINFANGAVPYEGVVVQLRCKASTAITVKTVGTFTGATYNVEGVIKQTA